MITRIELTISDMVIGKGKGGDYIDGEQKTIFVKREKIEALKENDKGLIGALLREKGK